MMEEEPDPYSDAVGSEEKNDNFDEDFVKVPDSVNVPESSSSPEMIGIEEEHEEKQETLEQEHFGSRKEGELVNLDREPDILPPIDTTSSYVGAIEDIVPQYTPSVPPAEGSPSRPGTKTVETPKATGYLSFLNASHPVVLYLIYWLDPKLSILSLVMSLVVLLTLYVNTFVHTVTLLLLAAMVVSLLYIVTKIAIDSFYNRPIVNPFNKYLQTDLSIPEDQLIEFARYTARRLNCRLRFLVKIVFFENTLNSLKFMIGLFLVSYVTNCFDILTTLFLGIITLYTVPVVYKKYQVTIDEHINNTVFKLTNTYSRIVEKIPFLPKVKSE